MSPIWQQAEWVSETFITDDTAAIAARADAEHTALQVRLAKGAARFDRVAGLSPDTRRKLDLLKLTITMPAPDSPGAGDELSAIAARIQSIYGKIGVTTRAAATLYAVERGLLRAGDVPA